MGGGRYVLRGFNRSTATGRPVARAEEKTGTQEAKCERPAEEEGWLLLGDVFYLFE
jgi:hypothetical protein